MEQHIILNKSPEYYFQKASQILLNPESPPDSLSNATKVLHTVLGRITGIEGAIRDPREKFETRLESGFALSPGYAADCTLDTPRIVKYVRALDAGIKDQMKKNKGKPVKVLYAGCGPYAPFVLPFTQLYRPLDIQFTLLDIHKRSIDAVKKIIDQFSIRDFFTDIIISDATKYECQKKDHHILITETMHRTLTREPHVMITKNLAAQMAPGGILIPMSVAISACFSDYNKEALYVQNKITKEEINRIRMDIGPVFEITMDSEHVLTEDGLFFKGPKIRIPENAHEKNVLVLLTHIQLNKDIQIEEKETGISFPYFVENINKFTPGEIIEFLFRIKDNPGIHINVYSELSIE